MRVDVIEFQDFIYTAGTFTPLVDGLMVFITLWANSTDGSDPLWGVPAFHFQDQDIRRMHAYIHKAAGFLLGNMLLKMIAAGSVPAGWNLPWNC